MIFFNVNPSKIKALEERMQKLGILEKDLEEKFVRSQGHGGQKVNKTSSCVYLKHLPTGIEVKVQKERHQSLNRFLARRILADKIEARQRGFVEEKQQLIEKIRRQKRKRSKRAKEKMLQNKHVQSDKKDFRKKITNFDY